MSRDRHRLPLRALGWICWLVCLGLAGPGWAATSVFHSPNDDGLPGSTVIPSGGVQSVYLWVDGGAVASSGGTVCNVGTGDEVCGYTIELTGLNGLTLSSFAGDAGANLLVNFSAGSMKVNGLDTQSPTAGPHRIGELFVNAVGGGEVELSSGEVIGADLSSEALASATVVTVPEPSQLALLASGIGLLLTLARRRGRS